MSQTVRPLQFFEPILSPILQRIVKHSRFRARPGLAEILAAHPRLVVVFNHSSPLSWLPAVSLLTAHACAKGGGQRRPMGVMDRFFFSVPGLRAIAHQLTQSDHPLGFHELIAKFKSLQGTDIVIFPEGSNCFFGHPDELQPFRSPRFVELAVRSETPILICAHRGSESWGQAVPIPTSWLAKLDLLPTVVADFLGARLRKTGLLTIPLLPRALEHFDMLVEIYEPKLKLSDLADEPEASDAQIRVEADRVRGRLEELLREIDESLKPSASGSSQT